MEENTKKLMKKSIDAEFEAIIYYLDNLDNLNYQKNKKVISKLVLDSFTHAQMITHTFLERYEPKKVNITENAREGALKEETGMKEIYLYELSKIRDKNLDALFLKLSKMEEEHEKLVKKLL